MLEAQERTKRRLIVRHGASETDIRPDGGWCRSHICSSTRAGGHDRNRVEQWMDGRSAGVVVAWLHRWKDADIFQAADLS